MGWDSDNHVDTLMTLEEEIELILAGCKPNIQAVPGQREKAKFYSND